MQRTIGGLDVPIFQGDSREIPELFRSRAMIQMIQMIQLALVVFGCV